MKVLGLPKYDVLFLLLNNVVHQCLAHFSTAIPPFTSNTPPKQARSIMISWSYVDQTFLHRSDMFMHYDQPYRRYHSTVIWGSAQMRVTT